MFLESMTKTSAPKTISVRSTSTLPVTTLVVLIFTISPKLFHVVTTNKQVIVPKATLVTIFTKSTTMVKKSNNKQL